MSRTMRHEQKPAIPPGSRVAVDDELGTVVEPTANEITYAKAEYDGSDWSPQHVLVRFDGDEDWDRGWYAPDEVRVLDEGEKETT